jgi:glucokinase-like ROK family protein
MRPLRGHAASAGSLLELIRLGGPATRGELAARTGLARSTVAQRVDALLARNLLQQSGEAPSTGGRPAAKLVFNPRSGLALAADIGATHSRVAVSDLSGLPLAETSAGVDIADGPEVVLDWVEQRFDGLLAEVGATGAEVRAVGIGVPGPVQFATGRPVNPPIMPGWHDYPVADRVAARHGVPVLVDNDVNIMALGEQRTTWPDVDDLLYIKVGTGIGCGIVVHGELYRGYEGAAGDIGHIRVSGHDDVICECGNTGCLEAVAGGRALARHARALGLDAHDSRDVVALVRAHNLHTVRLVREAGRVLGEVLSSLVNAINPEVIVIGGDLAHAHEQLFAGVRETVYGRSTPLATQRLQIERSSLGDHAGVRGAAVMAIEHILSPEVIDRDLERAAAASGA